MTSGLSRQHVRMTALILLMLMLALAPRLSAVKAAPAQQAITCTMSVSTPTQSGSNVVATVSASCTGNSFISLNGTLQGPTGTTPIQSRQCFGTLTCSLPLSAPFAWGTWTATGWGYYNSSVQFPSTSSSRTFTQPQPAYWLKLQSIECIWTNDATGGDEPRLFVNEVQRWSDDYFAKGDINSLTHLPRIRFSDSSASLPVLVKEYDAWPGSTVTFDPRPAYVYKSDSTATAPLHLDFSRGGGNYRLTYIVVYEI